MKFNNENQIKLKKWDLYLVLIILLGALCAFLFLWNRESGSRVVVYVDGQEVAQYSLTDSRELILAPQTDSHNVLVIENGKCYISDADCPDQICVKQGEISKNGQTITCLPHKLVIMVASEEPSEVDAVVQ